MSFKATMKRFFQKGLISRDIFVNKYHYLLTYEGLVIGNRISERNNEI